MPAWFKFLWVLQLLILNPEGSPPPGAKECLIKITLSPSFAGAHGCSEEYKGKVLRKKTIIRREILRLFMVDEMIILQTYDALVYVTWQINFKHKLSCIKSLNWFVNNYSPLGLKTKHMPLLQ